MMAKPLTRSIVLLGGLDVALCRSMWSSTPAAHGNRESDDYVLKTAYPLGNGRLGAMPVGPPGDEQLILNVDSLWAGGPFETSDYRGGNPSEDISGALPEIRSTIFEEGTGNVDGLLGGEEHFGSYRVLGNLTVTYDVPEFTNYRRTLDLKTGLYTTEFSYGDDRFSTTVFCSHPDEICIYQLSGEGSLPSVSITLENQLVSPDLLDLTCGDRYARLTGVTQEGPPEGLKYDAIARISDHSHGIMECSDAGVLEVTPEADERSITVAIGASTNYDMSKGGAESGFSFKGDDPAEFVETITSDGAAETLEALLERHRADYSSLDSAFSLDLPDPHGSSSKETADLLSGYEYSQGDPFVEALLFDYSRYLLISSSRDSLPANLAGLWTEELQPAWNGDYHININLQMNYWPAEQTGLGDTESALWNYMRHTLVPRGTETARLLYNGSGWVTHHGSNIFGYTAMGSEAGWANYPAAPAWMMQHVWDHFDYTQDTEWLKDVGYPLLKGVAEFWLSQLQDDAFTHDSSLVVNPCNSPEHGPTSFGCTHYHQEIHQTFEAVLASASVVSGSDSTFLEDLETALSKLDKGLHYTSWGGLKEWKLPDSFGVDTESDHRHLSHLTGWYPGYSIASFLNGYASAEVQSAVRKTLTARGNGTAADADSGWAKVWRTACWARLNDTEHAYNQLRYAIGTNFAGNGFSMYSGLDAPFQIDANFGLGGAVLSMLVVDMPLTYDSSEEVRTVVLGPAVPGEWGDGAVKGLRIRGGGSVDFSWDNDGLVQQASLKGAQSRVRLVNKKGELLADS